MSSKPLRWLAAATLALAGAAAQAQIVIDQVYEPPVSAALVVNGSNAGQPFWLGQTFTAGLTGTLASVDLAIWRAQAVDFGLILKLFDANGLTLGAELGALAIDAGSIPVGYQGNEIPPPGVSTLGTRVDLSSLGIHVEAGSSYALVVSALRTEPVTLQTPLMTWYGSLWSPGAIDHYPGGERGYTYASALGPGDSLFPTEPLEDLGFRTYVATVPEVSTAWLSALGALVVVIRGARQRAAC